MTSSHPEAAGCEDADSGEHRAQSGERVWAVDRICTCSHVGARMSDSEQEGVRKEILGQLESCA